MALSYEMYRLGADSFSLIAEPAMQPFWIGYKQGLYDRFHGGEPSKELLETELYAQGYQAGREGVPAISLIPMLLEDDFQ